MRIEDYLKALSATGKPPAPCPAQPTAPASRAVLGLPPLFQPHSIEDPPTPTTISEIPAAQVFTPSRIADETFYSITANVKYDGFSFEVRHITVLYTVTRTDMGDRSSASRRTRKATRPPQGQSRWSPSSRRPSHPRSPPDAHPQATLGRRSSVSPPRPRTPGTASRSACVRIYLVLRAHMSFLQELRVAYLRAGRELTSAEITGPSADVPGLISPVVPATPQQPPSLFSSTTPGSGFSRSPAVRPF